MAVPDTQSNLRLHPDEDLRRRDGVSYQCKFEGTYSVTEPKGLPVVQRACELMRDGKTRRKDMGVKQAPMVTVHISVQGIEVYSGEEVVTKTHILKVPIDKISYIARDPSDRHYLAVVYETSPPGPTDKPDFECTLFKHDITKTREMVLTLNQAFDLAYEIRVKEGKIPKVSMKEQVDIYRSRLKQMSDLLPGDKLTEFLRLLNITEVTEIRGLGQAGKGQAPHTMVSQASVDPLANQQLPRKPPTPPVSSASATTASSSSSAATPTSAAQAAAPAKPLLQTAAANKMILDFGDDDPAWAPVGQQQPQQQKPQQHQPQAASGGGFGSDFFGAPFVPVSSASAGSSQQQQQQQQSSAAAGQDLMRLGFSPMDADMEFDPLKLK